eukprot:15048413-Alexandrium_andersonii.AAC.1
MLSRDVGADYGRLVCSPATGPVPGVAAPCGLQSPLAGRGGWDPHVRGRRLCWVLPRSAVRVWR